MTRSGRSAGGRRGGGRECARPAFTIAELIVSVVVLVIALSLVVPRLGRDDQTRALASIEAVRATLSALAMADARSTQPLALEYDASAGMLRGLGPDPDPRSKYFWRRDPMVPAAELADIRLQGLSMDGRSVTGLDRGAAIELPQGERRPVIDAVLERPSTGRRWTVRLESQALRAIVLERDGTTLGPTVLDLDARARGQWPW